MTEREKLIELLCNNFVAITTSYLEEVADRLIDNGVAIPVYCGEALMQENARLKAERDAAVADLTKRCSHKLPRPEEDCDFCVHFDDDFDCSGCKWEWRGAEHLRDATKMIKEEKEDADDRR